MFLHNLNENYDRLVMILHAGWQLSMGLEKTGALSSYLKNNNGGTEEEKANGCKSDNDCAKLCHPQCKSKNCVKGVCICGCSNLFQDTKL